MFTRKARKENFGVDSFIRPPSKSNMFGPRKEAEVIENAMDQDLPPHVVAGIAGAVIFGFLGGIAGAYAGAAYFGVLSTGLPGGGMPVIMSAGAGFLMVGGLFLACGPYGQHHMKLAGNALQPPEWRRFQKTGFSTWDLYVTVHRCQNAYNVRQFFGLLMPSFLQAGPSYFATVRVGREIDEDIFLLRSNPVKKTCTTKDQVFEEVFHFVVTPTDDTLRVVVWDQGTLIDRRLGSVDINITNQILEAGFPQNKGFRLSRSSYEEGDDSGDEEQEVEYQDIAGTIVLSFKPGPNFPRYANARYRSNQPYEHHSVYTSNSELMKGVKTNYPSYGTWATNVNGHPISS